MDLSRQIAHACKELKLTPMQIAQKFGILVEFIEPEHIAQLWREKFQRRGK